MSRRTILTLVFAVGLLAPMARASAGPPQPRFPVPDVYKIRGTVRDPLGRGVGGAAVAANRIDCNPTTDPDQCLARQRLTDASGYYEIGENATGRFVLVVSKPGTTGASREITVILPADVTEDFSTTYLISGSFSTQFLSTVSGIANSLLTLTSWAPLPKANDDPNPPSGSSCVKVRDLRTGSIFNASYAGPATGGGYTWTWTLSIPQGSTEGWYRIEVWAEACTVGTMLTVTGEASYLVDNTAPLLALAAPQDGGNTIYSDQRLIFRAEDRTLDTIGPPESEVQIPGEDSGAGIDPSSIQVTVRDVTRAGTEQQLAATLSGNVVRSAPAALSWDTANPNVLYEARATAADRAGNGTTSSGTFLLVRSASGTSPQLSIDQTPPSSKQSGGPTELDDLYVWSAPTVNVGGFSVQFDQTLHSGDGAAVVPFSPDDSARVTYNVQGSPVPTILEPNPLELTAQVLVPFHVTQSGAATASVVARQGETGQITALVPKSADPGSVRLYMNSVPAGVVGFPTCSDPSTTSGCLPDPIAVDRHEDRWQPWADVLDTDPFLLPQLVADNVDLGPLPAGICPDSPPSLDAAVQHLGSALGVQDSLLPGQTLDPALSTSLARVIECMAMHVPRLVPVHTTPTTSQRQEWLAAMGDLLSALRRIPSSASFPPNGGPLDDRDLIELGHDGYDHFTFDSMLIVDPGDTRTDPAQDGDLYENNAGGAVVLSDPALNRPIAIVLDRRGNDEYKPPSTRGGSPSDPTIGSGGFGGIGILVDADGSDTYVGRSYSQGAAYLGAGYLLDSDSSGTGSNDQHSILANGSAYVTMGAAYSGFGFLQETPSGGSDSYAVSAGGQGMGFGRGVGAVGMLVGGAGSSTFSSCGACQLTLGTGFGGGVGVLLDRGGRDSYTCPAFAECLGAAAGISSQGVVLDGAGDSDTYELPLGASGGLGLAFDEGSFGAMIDIGGAETYTCRATSCLGVGVFGGEGVFLDLGQATDGYTFGASTRRPTLVLPSGTQRGNSKLWIGEQGQLFGVGIDAS